MIPNSVEEGEPDEAALSTTIMVEEAHVGERLDAFLAARLSGRSRVQLRRVIAADGVLVDGQHAKPAYRLKAGQVVTVSLPELPRASPVPEDIPLAILHEDAHLVAINKPSGMVVHPAKGHWSGTLAGALVHHFQSLSTVGGGVRPGIVHRLDRDTSGVIVVAKTDQAHVGLAEQFEHRETEKEYWAIVRGRPDRDRDVIDAPIGPHPHHREKMAIRHHPDSRQATTFYEVLQRFAGFSLLRVLPKTGRTHQIRVHLAHAGYPVLCDRLYGGSARISRGELHHRSADEMVLLERQALHAARLKISHPITGEPLEFQAPMPADMRAVLDELTGDASHDV